MRGARALERLVLTVHEVGERLLRDRDERQLVRHLEDGETLRARLREQRLGDLVVVEARPDGTFQALCQEKEMLRLGDVVTRAGRVTASPTTSGSGKASSAKYLQPDSATTPSAGIVSGSPPLLVLIHALIAVSNSS